MNYSEMFDTLASLSNDELDSLISHARATQRLRLSEKSAMLRVGDLAKVESDTIRPRYIVGAICKVVKVNSTTITVEFPEDPAYKKYSGANGVRVPKTALTSIS